MAAGVFFQERRALLTALKMLLAAAAAGPEAAAAAPAAAVAQRFVSDLLGERRGARSALLARLLELVQVLPLRPPSALMCVWPTSGNLPFDFQNQFRAPCASPQRADMYAQP